MLTLYTRVISCMFGLAAIGRRAAAHGFSMLRKCVKCDDSSINEYNVPRMNCWCETCMKTNVHVAYACSSLGLRASGMFYKEKQFEIILKIIISCQAI